MSKLSRSVLLALLGLGMVSAFAQTDPRFDAFMQTVSGNKTTIAFGGGGTPVATSSAPLGTPSVQGMGFSRTAEGVFMESTGAARLPGGRNTVPISTKLKLSGPVIGKALGRAVLLYSAWEAGSALYDIWSDAGLQIDSTGKVTDPANTPAGVYVSEGYYATAGYTKRYYALSEWCSARLQYYRSNGYPNSVQTGCFIEGAYNRLNFSYNGSNLYVIDMRYSSSSTCPSGYYVSDLGCSPTAPSTDPLTEQDIADFIAAQSGWPDSTIASALADAVRLPGIGPLIAPDIEALPQTETQTQVQGVPQGTPVQVGDPVTTEEVTQNPDGTTTTKTTTTTTEVVADGNELTQRQTTATTTTVTDGTGAVISTTTGTTTTDKTATTPAPSEVIVCGLPDTPPCKIDETGTPEADEIDTDQVTQLFEPIVTCFNDLEACLPALPDLNWSFSLPTGCSAITIDAFAPYLTSIDVCQFQPMIHDLMSLLWAAAGLFAAVQMVFREATGS